MQGDAQSGPVSLYHPASLKDTLDSTVVLDSVRVMTTGNVSNLGMAEEVSAIKNEEPAVLKPKTISGIASFYSKSFEGTKTATGEIFRHAKYTAASNSLPLNTWVRVTNLRTSKTVIVRINDRMHPKMARKGRVIDLTSTAAKKIGLTSRIGITKVSLEVVEKDTLE